jgi:hypothetical protein
MLLKCVHQNGCASTKTNRKKKIVLSVGKHLPITFFILSEFLYHVLLAHKKVIQENQLNNKKKSWPELLGIQRDGDSVGLPMRA